MNMNPREKRLAIATGLTLGLGLVWSQYLSPAIDEIAAAREEAERLESDLEGQALALQRDQRTAAKLPSIEKGLAANRLDRFLDVVQGVRLESGLDLSSNQALSTKKEKDHVVHGRQYRLAGSLAQVVTFLALLDAQKIPLAVPAISITTEDGAAFEIQVQLTTLTGTTPPAGEGEPAKMAQPAAARAPAVFGTVHEKNVYAPFKEKPAPRPEPGPRMDPSPVTKVEVREKFTPRGVFWDSDSEEYKMFVEDQEGRVKLVGAGEKLGTYEVSEVSFGSLVLAAADGPSTEVSLGESFEGAVIATREVSAAAPAPAPGSDPAPATNGGGRTDVVSDPAPAASLNDDQKADLRRQMMERRRRGGQQQPPKEGENK